MRLQKLISPHGPAHLHKLKVFSYLVLQMDLSYSGEQGLEMINKYDKSVQMK